MSIVRKTRECLRQEFLGEPDVGNLLVRFDEGGVGRADSIAHSSTLLASW